MAVADLINVERGVYFPVFSRQPIVAARGDGIRLWDIEGKEYLDFTAGLGVNVLGHCAPAVMRALDQQARTLIHTSNVFYSLPQLELAKRLIDVSAFDRVFFTNSGAEANECAIKVARRWASLHKKTATNIVCSTTGFHGRTLATLAAGGHVRNREGFGPMPPGFQHIPYNDVEALDETLGDSTIALMLEPVQGYEGVFPASRRYLESAANLCRQRSILLMFDEIQSGMGRTGRLWAYERHGVEPDVMTVAKALGGGFPIGACLVKEHASVLSEKEHGSTFGGNPLACAVGLAVLEEVVERNLPAVAESLGEYLGRALAQLDDPDILQIRQIGLWIAIDLENDQRRRRVMHSCREQGVLVNAAGARGSIRISPPLIVTKSECDRFMEVFRRALIDTRAA
jgi:predicted acetylornithine/succinylornithine family transaminase